MIAFGKMSINYLSGKRVGLEFFNEYLCGSLGSPILDAKIWSHSQKMGINEHWFTKMGKSYYN